MYLKIATHAETFKAPSFLKDTFCLHPCLKSRHLEKNCKQTLEKRQRKNDNPTMNHFVFLSTTSQATSFKGNLKCVPPPNTHTHTPYIKLLLSKTFKKYTNGSHSLSRSRTNTGYEDPSSAARAFFASEFTNHTQHRTRDARAQRGTLPPNVKTTLFKKSPPPRLPRPHTFKPRTAGGPCLPLLSPVQPIMRAHEGGSPPTSHTRA